jgi:hypothetical protein
LSSRIWRVVIWSTCGGIVINLTTAAAGNEQVTSDALQQSPQERQDKRGLVVLVVGQVQVEQLRENSKLRREFGDLVERRVQLERTGVFYDPR